MKTALIVVAAKFVEDEVTPIYYRLQEAGFEVDVYCAKPTFGKKDNLCCLGKYGAPIPVTTMSIPYPVRWDELPDILVIPGGVESTEVLRQNEALLNLVRTQMKSEKMVISQCHGPQVLISAGVTKGKKMTCYKGMAVDLINSGADYVDAPAVVDGNLVTSPHYKNNAAYMKAALEQYNLRNNVIH